MKYVLALILMCSACNDVNAPLPDPNGSPHGQSPTPPVPVTGPNPDQPALDLSQPVDLAQPSCSGAPDLAQPAPADLAQPLDLGAPSCSPDLAPAPDNDDCACFVPGHGQGGNHCQVENHVPGGEGHGNGHCKYDC
jgi:hypothetical protein